MSFETSELDRLLSSLMIPGQVGAVDAAAGMVRIVVDDGDGVWESSFVPWLSIAAGTSRFWRVPEAGEQALLLCPSGEPDNGFALVGWFTDGFGRDGRADVVAWKMPDGAAFEYCFSSGKLSVDGCKEVAVTAADLVQVKTTRVVLDAPDVLVTGNLMIGGGLTHAAGDGQPAQFGSGVQAKGDIKADGDVVAGAVSLDAHHHEEHDGPQTSAAKP